MLRGIARSLDLDRVGYRRTWTVRRSHGVYVVALRQSPLGDHILLDGKEVARAQPWRYEGALRFAIDGAPAEARFVTDTTRGTMWTDLYVDGVLVPPDTRMAATPPPVRWRSYLERAAYVLGGAMVFAGLVGSPVFEAVRQAMWTVAVLVLLAGLRAIDPFGAITVTLDKIVEDRASMIVAGIEIALIAAIARDRWRSRQRLPFIRERSWVPRLVGWSAIVAVAFVILMLS
ncbi:MAG TPA: hypothetical protein VJ726_10620 [Candidatus Limnocylindria bacterium]|nr:hypothetical protein [Candidatus Limnocylindria bacterium]